MPLASQASIRPDTGEIRSKRHLHVSLTRTRTIFTPPLPRTSPHSPPSPFPDPVVRPPAASRNTPFPLSTTSPIGAILTESSLQPLSRLRTSPSPPRSACPKPRNCRPDPVQGGVSQKSNKHGSTTRGSPPQREASRSAQLSGVVTGTEHVVIM